MTEPWSWGLSVPFSLYLKLALDIHAHLGICVGIGIPSLVYWGATRGSIDWYWETVLKFNIEIMKTGLFNLVIGLLHLVVSKVIHHIIEWVKDHTLKKGLLGLNWPVISKLESSTTTLTFYEHYPLLRPVSAKDISLKMLEALGAFFYNGNVLLLSWCFSGQIYSSEVGKAISWVSMGSSMLVWIKALLKLMQMPQTPPDHNEKSYKKVDKNQDSSIHYKEGSKDQAITTSSLEC